MVYEVNVVLVLMKIIFILIILHHQPVATMENLIYTIYVFHVIELNVVVKINKAIT